jgi:hypothetical protein
MNSKCNKIYLFIVFTFLLRVFPSVMRRFYNSNVHWDAALTILNLAISYDVRGAPDAFSNTISFVKASDLIYFGIKQKIRYILC